MRTAILVRIEDVSGSSGTGIVGEIVQFNNGWSLLFWLSETTSFKFFPTIEDMEKIHSHGGRTRIVWMDEIWELQRTLPKDDPLLGLIKGIGDRRLRERRLRETYQAPTAEELAMGAVPADNDLKGILDSMKEQ